MGHYTSKKFWATRCDLSLGFMNSEAVTASSESAMNNPYVKNLLYELSKSIK